MWKSISYNRANLEISSCYKNWNYKIQKWPHIWTSRRTRKSGISFWPSQTSDHAILSDCVYQMGVQFLCQIPRWGGNISVSFQVTYQMAEHVLHSIQMLGNLPVHSKIRTSPLLAIELWVVKNRSEGGIYGHRLIKRSRHTGI